MKMLLIIAALTVCCLSGCLTRTSYYEPSTEFHATNDDGEVVGPVKEKGQYPFWSDASGKSFLNPTISLIGK